MDNVGSKMKIIHTSDWHIGQIFNEYDRSEEHLAFFSELADIISAEKPDALLVSGDVFDSAMPSAQSQRLYTDALLRLKNSCPDMTIVVSAGNHDSGAGQRIPFHIGYGSCDGPRFLGIRLRGKSYCQCQDGDKRRYSGRYSCCSL